MSPNRYRFPWFLILAVAIGVTALFFIGRYRIAVDTDILASLPQGDPIIADARDVITHHPIQERIVIDIGQRGNNPERLVAEAVLLEKRLQNSGLFKTVGLSREQQLFPALIAHVTENFSVLFNERDLQGKIAPLIAPEKIREALTNAQAALTGLEGFGQADTIARDPLGFRSIILERMAPLAPSGNVVFFQGQLLSADRKHLLIIAEPVTSGYDTAFSRKVTALIADASRQLDKKYAGSDALTLTPFGAYRASLDNETAAKTGTHRAVFISTIAIALLLLGFPRPWIGLLALLPAFAGTMVAVFVYSLFQKSISILAIGFGGAIISFTVDYGIAYLLFLDRPYETHGLEATKEVWSLGLLAMLTTAVSFAFLFVAGFPALSQLGAFAALGVVFTYIFVHAVYPFLFPKVPPAKRDGFLPLQGIADTMTKGGMTAAVAAILFGAVMLFFAKPDFRVDLQAMNSVSQETLAAEKLIRGVWGDVFSRIFLAVEGKTLPELHAREDRLAGLLEEESKKGTVTAAFVPSMIFPGEERAKGNFAAWQAFWTAERVAELRRTMAPLSRELGFSPQAFDGFYAALKAKAFRVPTIPSPFFSLLGIVQKQDGTGWTQFASVQPGPAYSGELFYKKMAAGGLAKVFDPALFGDRLGRVILNGFINVAMIVGIMTFLVSLLYLFHFRLTLIALLPTAFSLICTIGTLRLCGQTLGIPVIIVSAVVIGMGTDYALYLVRAYQRYMKEDHPSVKLIRLSIFLSFATTFIGFGVLALSGHTLLKSAGLALALGIGYSYLGTVTLVPPLLRHLLVPVPFGYEPLTAGSKEHTRRTRRHYRNMEGYPRLFARLKLMLDPMFPRLAGFVRDPRVILDVGTGFGIPAVWLLELFPNACVFGIEPDKKRVLFASMAIGERGAVTVGLAPQIPEAPQKADTITMLDMLHYLSDADLALTLSRLREAAAPECRLIIRATIPTMARSSWTTRIEKIRMRIFKIPSYYRQVSDIEKALLNAGFRVTRIEPSVTGGEKQWIIAETDAFV
jgi:predicted exporter/16S rRNA G527 N7-methylase RsmG